jgi:GNAT superfamily N-acetyltransferase
MKDEFQIRSTKQAETAMEQPASPVIKTVQSLDQLRQVWSFAAPILELPAGKHTLEYYIEQFARTPRLLVFAEGHSRICGCILASIEVDHVLVGPVAVAADSRKMGIGKAMMREVEKQAKDIGQSTLILGSREEAEAFYLSCGFQPNLFVQLPVSGSAKKLRSLNEKYEVIWETQQEGWSKLMLHTPPDRQVFATEIRAGISRVLYAICFCKTYLLIIFSIPLSRSSFSQRKHLDYPHV